MGCEVVLIVALVCLLQCQQYQAQSNQNVVQIQIPGSSIRIPPPCQGTVPYPLFSQYLNSCNGCQSSICQKTCTNTNRQLNIGFSQNPVSVSIPSGKSTVTLVLNNKPKPTNNKQQTNKQQVDVKVKITPAKNKTADGKPSVSSSGNATAISDKGGTQLVSNIIASDSNYDIEITIVVSDTGNGLVNSELDSSVTIIDSEGNESTTNTTSKAIKKRKDKSQSPSGPGKQTDNNGSINKPNKTADKIPPQSAKPSSNKSSFTGTPTSTGNNDGTNIGDRGTTTGNSVPNTGDSVPNTGDNGATPENSGINTGVSGTTPGDSGTTPGNSGANTGDSGINTGSDGSNTNAATSSASAAAASGGSK